MAQVRIHPLVLLDPSLAFGIQQCRVVGRRRRSGKICTARHMVAHTFPRYSPGLPPASRYTGSLRGGPRWLALADCRQAPLRRTAVDRELYITMIETAVVKQS